MSSQHKFRNTTLPIEERIEDLRSQLSLEEKCAQLRFDAPPIERLEIPEYNWWSEALHGVGRAGKTTVFPQAIGLSATWDPEFIESVASAISDEARAKHHEAARQGSHQQYQGLTFWTPNINIFRDPRWGRGQETWGEDPYLTGELGAAFVHGLQGRDSKYLKTAACAKHYAVHSGPESVRHEFDACPSKKDFEETYLPAFKRLVDAGVETVMGAYNAVYGDPCNGSRLLLDEILRKRWGFEGHVVSDCWAIRDFHTNYKVTGSVEESAALAIKSGCDLNCGSVFCDALLDAVNLGYCSEEDIDRALVRLLRTRFKLGMFDPEEDVPYAHIPYSVVRCDKHRELALEAALRSVVLLKNKDQALPLDNSVRSALVVGPYAANVEVLLGNYFGISDRMTSLLEGIAQHAPPELKIDFRKGCLSNHPNANTADWSYHEAAAVDVVIAAIGIDPSMEGEEGDAIESPVQGDRVQCGLPACQRDYLLKVSETMQKDNSSAKLIVVLFGGSHLIVPEVDEVADAVLQVWYPGEAGGDAIARILFGLAAPEGRMTITVPNALEAIPPFEDYSMQGRTYRFMDPKDILYPFGFGLGYSAFSYQDLNVSQSAIKHGDCAELSVALSNNGNFDNGEIIQVYAKLSGSSDLLLWAFKRVFVLKGETVLLDIPLDTNRLQVFDEDGQASPYTGSVEVYVGPRPPVETPVTSRSPAPLSTSIEVVA